MLLMFENEKVANGEVEYQKRVEKQYLYEISKTKD